MSLLRDHADALARALEEIDALEAPLESAAGALAGALAAGGKVLAAGNGGSAAEAQHLSSELLGRLHASRERAALAAIALHADTSTITALGNDYGFDAIFARQVEGLGRAGDVLVVLSTSGNSANLVRAVEVARSAHLTTVAFVGAGPAALHEMCDFVLAVPSVQTAVIQECHLLLVHALVERVEEILNAGAG